MSRLVKPRLALLVGIFSFVFPLSAELSLDGERLDLEMRMQKRVEDALGKILPVGQFVVVIRVEPLAKGVETQTGSQRDNSGYYLPGVPVKTDFDNTNGRMQELVDTLKPDSKIFQRFIKRIQVTLVLDQDLADDIVSKVRDLTRQMLSLDAARGDTLDIQRTAFAKPIDVQANSTGMLKLQREIKSYWALVLLALVLFCVAVFFLFMFGPLRGFLNNFVQILPTLKPQDSGRRGMDMPYLPGYMPYGLPTPPPAAAGSAAAFSGSLQVENPNKTVLPFGFIREDHIGNLAILLARETPEKAAVVLGYLPPEWISRVLARLEPAMQSEVAAHLATTRQLLPEQVEDIEQDLKRRLDYLIGGPDRIFAVYESLEPDAQRRMLESLKESRPEIVEELRHRTLLFDDLERLEPAALKAVLREVDLQLIVTSLRGVSDTLIKRILEHMSEGKAEIVGQELELNRGAVAGKATLEAQRKVVLIAKRLEREGQINIPHVEDAPASRFGSSLRSTLKLPPGLKLEDTISIDPAAPSKPPKEDIREKIKRFMGRRGHETAERYPSNAPGPDSPNDRRNE